MPENGDVESEDEKHSEVDGGDAEDRDESADEGVRSRFRNLARRLMDRPLAEDTKDVLYAVLNTSDKAKTEMVRMVAREVRHYLDELKLKDDLMELVRNHSLEISISLTPIADKLEPAPDGAEEE